MFDVPILFLIYNRADLTGAVFSKIREIQPKSLFIAADGPKNDVDFLECKKTREIIDYIDWSCEIKTLFRDQNLGCRLAVSSAISWFFEHKDQGIILEDDTVPNPSFFTFCKDLLDKYKANKEISSISGITWAPEKFTASNDYYFSYYPGIWGWATWADRWEINQSTIGSYRAST
jgi:hypothetical protein